MGVLKPRLAHIASDNCRYVLVVQTLPKPPAGRTQSPAALEPGTRPVVRNVEAAKPGVSAAVAQPWRSASVQCEETERIRDLTIPSGCVHSIRTPEWLGILFEVQDLETRTGDVHDHFREGPLVLDSTACRK